MDLSFFFFFLASLMLCYIDSPSTICWWCTRV